MRGCATRLTHAARARPGPRSQPWSWPLRRCRTWCCLVLFPTSNALQTTRTASRFTYLILLHPVVYPRAFNLTHARCPASLCYPQLVLTALPCCRTWCSFPSRACWTPPLHPPASTPSTPTCLPLSLTLCGRAWTGRGGGRVWHWPGSGQALSKDLAHLLGSTQLALLVSSTPAYSGKNIHSRSAQSSHITRLTVLPLAHSPNFAQLTAPSTPSSRRSAPRCCGTPWRGLSQVGMAANMAYVTR